MKVASYLGELVRIRAEVSCPNQMLEFNGLINLI